MNKFPTVAILLAAYNGLAYIGQQLETILAQRDVKISIFISVDRSDDATQEWCEQFAIRHPNVAVLPYGERYGGAALNFFRLLRDVDFSQHDFVAFADQDDIWLEDKLMRAIEMMRSTESAGYSSNVTAFWDNGQSRLIEKSQPQRAWDYLFEAAGPGCTYVMQSELAGEIKLAVVNQWLRIAGLGLHDWFSYAYARANGYRWIIDERPGMLYRQHLGNQVGANHGTSAFIYRMRRVAEGWGISQSALTADLVGLGGSPFVRSWSRFQRFGLLQLAFRASMCRRRARDRVFFFFACCLLAVTGIPSPEHSADA